MLPLRLRDTTSFFLKTELQADEEIVQEKVLNQFYSDANTTIVIILLNTISLFIHLIIDFSPKLY